MQNKLFKISLFSICFLICSNVIQTNNEKLQILSLSKITEQKNLKVLLQELATTVNTTEENSFNSDKVTFFINSENFQDLNDSFNNALHPNQWFQLPLTAIGQFLYDFYKYNIFGEYTNIIGKAFTQYLCNLHKIKTNIDFSNIINSNDFVQRHRNNISEEIIFNTRNTITQLVQEIRETPLEYLTNEHYLEHTLLLKLGLNNECLNEFPSHLNKYYGKGLKSWQYPVQFSKFLVSLSQLKIDTYLEIGCRHGGTFIIICEYLKRFNPNLKSSAVDPYYSLIMDIYVNDITQNAEYFVDFSQSKRFIDLSKHHWDIAFIDGDHSLQGVTTDYNLVKNDSDILIFHDIVNDVCPGVIKCWNDLKAKFSSNHRMDEFIEQYQEVLIREGKQYLGIGVFYQNKV